MTYRLSYSGRKMTAMDILKIKIGVCEHYTRLYNALLNSVDIPAMYATGYALKSDRDIEKGSGHAWSVIKVDGKWMPMDATWNIFSGKLPCTHVFCDYDGRGYTYTGGYSTKTSFFYEYQEE